MSAKVYATKPGAAIAIDDYGVATIKNGVAVPDEVAVQFEEEIRGERTNPKFGQPVEPGEEPHPRTLKIGRGPRDDLKVVREEAAAAAPRPARLARPEPVAAPKPEEK